MRTSFLYKTDASCIPSLCLTCLLIWFRSTVANSSFTSSHSLAWGWLLLVVKFVTSFEPFYVCTLSFTLCLLCVLCFPAAASASLFAMYTTSLHRNHSDPEDTHQRILLHASVDTPQLGQVGRGIVFCNELVQAKHYICIHMHDPPPPHTHMHTHTFLAHLFRSFSSHCQVHVFTTHLSLSESARKRYALTMLLLLSNMC